jgi:hypothetical protein
LKGLKELKEYFDDETFLEKLIKFDDIPFIVYHDYNKDKIFELKNNHPILLDSNFLKIGIVIIKICDKIFSL